MSERENPWLAAPDENVRREPTNEVEPPRSTWTPGAEVIVEDTLPLAYPGLPADQTFWLVGAHGGAGTSTWARLLDAGDAGCAWPVLEEGFSRAVIVCRSNMHGLERARRCAIQWAAGRVPGVALAGLLIIPDAPGRLPKALKDAQQRTAGAFPHTIIAPWIGAWRVQEEAEFGTPSRALDRALMGVHELRNGKEPIA